MARRRCLDPRIKRRYNQSLTHLGLGNIARHAKRHLRSRHAWVRPRLPSPTDPLPGMPNVAPVKTVEIPGSTEPPIDTKPLPKVEKDDQELVDSILFGGFIPSDDNDDNDNNEDAPALETSYPIFISSNDNDKETPVLNTSEEAPALDNGLTLPQTPAGPISLSTLDSEAFARAQIADQPRLLIDLPLSGRKLEALYWSVSVGKWWYAWEQENPTKTNVSSHIGRIMETDLGTQLFGEKKCTRCQNEGLECWIYSEKAASRVKFAGTNCTRCRALPVSYGCSFATRRRNGKTPGLRIVSGNRRLLQKEY